MPDVSVVVPFRNTERHIGRCLRALEAQSPFDGTYEIVMVDDGSTDGSAAIAASSPRVRLLSSPTRGPYAARNTGVGSSAGSIIAFTDSDCEPSPDWLRMILAAMSDPVVTVVVGSRAGAGGSKALSLVAAYERTKDEFIFSSRVPELYYGSANNMAVHRETFERFGPFDERPRGSDALFVRRVVEGLSPDAVCFSAAMSVRHLEVERLRDYYRKVFVYGRSFRRFGRVGRVRPLRTSERFDVWRRTIEALSTLEAVRLLGLLTAGLAFWLAGSWSGALRETSS